MATLQVCEAGFSSISKTVGCALVKKYEHNKYLSLYYFSGQNSRNQTREMPERHDGYHSVAVSGATRISNTHGTII